MLSLRQSGRVLLILAVSALYACGRGAAKFEWTEEVELADGSIITVKRMTDYSSSSNAWGGGGAWAKLREAVVQISPTGSDSSVPWKMKLRPMLLDRDPTTGSWVVVSNYHGVYGNSEEVCAAWHLYGQPATPEIAFVLRDGSWNPIAVPMEFIGRRMNLLYGVPREDVSHVTVATKRAWDQKGRPAIDAIHSEEQFAIGKSIATICERLRQSMNEATQRNGARK